VLCLSLWPVQYGSDVLFGGLTSRMYYFDAGNGGVEAAFGEIPDRGIM
jgi:hypothetical protein